MSTIKIKSIDDIAPKLWEAANKLRGSLSAEEYMHVVIGVLSLKYISDRFDVALSKLNKDGFTIEEFQNSPEDFYYQYNAFLMDEESTWKHIMNYANNDKVGQVMDIAFTKLEEKNPMLEGIFDKNYNREAIDQNRLGDVVKVFSDSDFSESEEDIIGRIYEYFLGKFFKDRGQKSGEFYTPTSIVQLMVHILKPASGTIYDPACGTAGILVQSKRYIESINASVDNITVYGQEFVNVTWKLAKLNLILNGFPLKDIDGHNVLGNTNADTFTNDQHKDLKFDFVMANPPFNVKEWWKESLALDSRWKWGVPPKGNANYAWISHMVSKLNENGKAAIVLANGSLSSNGKEELAIRKQLLEDNLLDAIIELPDKLFYTTGIPACIWVFNKNKKGDNVLMVSSKGLQGEMINKTLREISESEINNIAYLYEKHLKSENISIDGIAKSVSLDNIKENDYSVVPGRYVGHKEQVVDKKAIKEEVITLTNELNLLLNEFNNLLPELNEAIEKIKNEDID